MPTEDMTPISDSDSIVGMYDASPDFFKAPPGMQAANIATKLIDILKTVGWTEVSSGYSVAQVAAYLGIKTTIGTESFPKTKVYCPPAGWPYMTFENSPLGILRSIGYDPNHQDPPPISIFCAYWPWGESPADSTSSFIRTIVDWMDSATVDNIIDPTTMLPTGGFVYTLSSNTPGPAKNGSYFFMDPAWGASGYARGGFIGLKSVGGPGHQQFQVAISAGPFTDAPGTPGYPDSFIEIGLISDADRKIDDMSQCDCIFYLNATRTFGNAPTGPWKIFFGPNHFLLSDSCNSATNSQSLWVCSPLSVGSHNCVFAFGPAELKKGLYADQGSARSIDGSKFVMNNANANPPIWPQLLGLRQNQVPLTTPDGVSLIYKPFVTMGLSGGDTPGIIGIAQDAFISTDVSSERMLFSGSYWEAVGFQDGGFGSTLGDGTFCKLFMATGQIK